MSGIGVLGGTFDPIHLGHLAMAERVRCELGLDKIIFVPAFVSPYKINQQTASPEARLEMVRLAIGDNPAFELSVTELSRGGTSYTVDTMEILSRENPGKEMYFLMGMDTLMDLKGWKGVDRLIELCRLVVVSRPGYEVSRERLAGLGLPGRLWERTIFLEAPGLEIASSELRGRFQRQESVRYLLPAPVEDYIRTHGLYMDPLEESPGQTGGGYGTDQG